MTNRILFTIPALVLCLTSAAQTPDTLRVRNVNEVTVITSKDSQTISLRGSANDSTFRFESSVSITPESSVSVRENRLDLFNWDVLANNRKTEETISVPVSASGENRVFRIRHSEMECEGFGIAMPYDGPSGINLGGKALSEIFIGVTKVDFLFFDGHLGLSTGINLGYRSFRLLDEGIFVKQDGQVIKTAVPQGLEIKKSALRSNYASIPATMSIGFGKRGNAFRIFGGAELNFNFNGRIKNAYTQDQTSVPTKYTDIRLEPFTWDYVAGFSIYDIGIYAKYSPCPFLKEGTGPSFSTYSVGLVFDM